MGIPDHPHSDSLDVEAAMDAAWPAPDRHSLGPWVLRAAGGVTQRANSIWPRWSPAGDGAQLRHLLATARTWYRSRRLPVIFQVTSAAPGAEALNAFLDSEGFTTQSETLIMTRGPVPAGTPAPGTAVEIAAQPSAEWLRVWWDVDGRGGDDALATAQTILEGCPSLYALVRDADGRAAAVGRLALPPSGTQAWGGLYSMATSLNARRRGYASAVLAALLNAGAERGVAGYWLLVTAANHGAQALYSTAGFREYGRYSYRQERPRRPLTGC